ncbi:transmembrane protein 72 isoform X1 [Scleropages formosus]|uniref:Transmembrane protein 72 n=1 Tax=Scleropages formosus TaxID=113540 RepID=A0A8C9W8V7_SCLFO|nr:transmembrane protein 72 isoform X1 [Scleropages formosus]
MKPSALWIVVECACRMLGVSTAAVLCAVGVETLRQGKFHNLAIYLLCPPQWMIFVLWKKVANLGGFQKFLYYTIMSVVCFLHPVLAWHAVIPGTMLLVTGLAYFILSKRKYAGLSKEACPHEHYSEALTAATYTCESGDTGHTYSFLRLVGGRRASALVSFPGMGGAGGVAQGRPQGVQDRPQGPNRKSDRRHVHFTEGTQSETELQEYEDREPEEVTCDKAPMIQV